MPWNGPGIELILEYSGKFKSPQAFNQYFETLGMKRFVVACPVKGEIKVEDALNIVQGINHDLYEPNRHGLITITSCTTNCLATVLIVVNQAFGIKHVSITRLYDLSNTQVIVYSFKLDLRRARSGSQSLIPTTTGEVKAIEMFFQELQGKLNSPAVRVPLLNGSLIDAVFELEKEVNHDRQ